MLSRYKKKKIFTNQCYKTFCKYFIFMYQLIAFKYDVLNELLYLNNDI